MSWAQDLEEVRRLYAAEPAPPAAVAGTRPFAPALLPLPLVAQDWVPDAPGELEFDAQDRPVAGNSGRVSWTWEWRADGSVLEYAQAMLGLRVALIRRDTVVSIDRIGRESVQRITWDGDVAVRADEALRWHGGNSHGADVARVADVDATGVVVAVRHKSAEAPEPDVEAGLVRAAGLSPTDLVWRRRALPELPTEAMVEPVARALATALRGAVAESELADPFLLSVGDTDSATALPPTGWLAAAAWREHVRATDPEDGAAARRLSSGVARGLVEVLTIADRLDAVTLEACRSLSAAHPAAWEVRRQVQARLAELLNAQLPLFVAVSSDGDDDALHQAYTVGADVEAFKRSITSTASPDAADAALRDRAALEALIREHGLGEHAHRLAYEVALEGFVLRPGDGRSHLGGPALLPPGEAWPDGHTFLAAIDRSEVELGSGWLLFFADIEEMTWDEVNAPGSPIRLFATDAPVPADGPALAPRPVRFERQLTLPGWYESGEDLGFDEAEDDAWHEARFRFLSAAGDVHRFGGHASGVQGERPQPGTVTLLYLGWDEELGFEYGDGGTVQFRIPEDALAAEDWSRVLTMADSS